MTTNISKSPFVKVYNDKFKTLLKFKLYTHQTEKFLASEMACNK